MRCVRWERDKRKHLMAMVIYRQITEVIYLETNGALAVIAIVIAIPTSSTATSRQIHLHGIMMLVIIGT